MEKFWETTAVELFSKKLQTAVSVTFPEMNSTVDIFLRISEDKNNYFCFVLILTKITFQIYEALTRTVFRRVCFSSSVNGTFKIQKTRSIWHGSAFIYILSISIHKIFFRHERRPQAYFHISWVVCFGPTSDKLFGFK